MAKMADLMLDAVACDTGIWQDIGPFEVKLRHASAANESFQKRVTELSRPHRLAIAAGDLPAEKANGIMYRAYAETIVVDWRGLTDDDGNPTPYTPEACVAAFKGNPRLFSAVQSLSGDDTLYRKRALDVAAKNS